MLRKLLIRILRLPPAPAPPAGSSASVQVFRASRNYYSYRLWIWALRQAGAGIGIVFGLLFLAEGIREDFFPWLDFNTIPGLEDFIENRILTVVEVFAIGAYLVQLPFSYLMIALDYELRWYLITDRSLRIREGLVRVREQTMTFANIQNLAVRQGPLQRYLKIQDLEVRTAGGSEKKADVDDKGDNLHIGRFRGVDNALELRDRILASLRNQRDSGLGDPDEIEPSQPQASAVASTNSVLAARELLSEARALRAVVETVEPGLPGVKT